jgi:cell fate regulator YaaT (PSP1 superfamily)
MRVGAVRIDYLNKTFLYDATEVEPEVGQLVVIETEFGLDTGMLVEEVIDANDADMDTEPPKIVRIATEEDIQKIQEMIDQEQEALTVCEEEVDKASLCMKLINARYSFDGSKVTFCYTAENRVDFRQLVRTLASRLRTRIELRQVGVRDEARLFGGIGQCGRQLCCATFLTSFQPVSIRMAKEQGLPLNPLKISGICGRLFCCLKYEFDNYREVNAKLPDVGKTIEFEGKKHRVISVNTLSTSVTAINEEGQRVNIPFELEFTSPCGFGGCNGGQCSKNQDQDGGRGRGKARNKTSDAPQAPDNASDKAPDADKAADVPDAPTEDSRPADEQE